MIRASSNSTGHQAANDNEVDRIIRLPEVMRITSLGRSTIYRKLQANPPQFPMALDLGENSVGWYLSEILDWIANVPRKAG